MTEIHFSKYQGTGNDFILLDARELKQALTKEQIAHLCDRHFGIGADGLMVLHDHKPLDFSMVYFNSDGKESTMCGNGGRCISAFAFSRGLAGNSIRFTAADGYHEATILHDHSPCYRVRLKMSDTSMGAIHPDGYFINTGSPHFVVRRENIDDPGLMSEGRKYRYDSRFAPGGANVNFCQEAGNGMRVRTYERGVEAETLSCGTGVTASALTIAFIRRKESGTEKIVTRGGELNVSYKNDGSGNFSDIWLEGDACEVFQGVIVL
jgi:diaminopimelate epimerase